MLGHKPNASSSMRWAAPNIAACCYIEKDRIIRIELSLSPSGFLCDIFGGDDPLRTSLLQWFANYAKGMHIPFPAQFPPTSPFRAAVLQAIAAIPFGQTASYGDIARAIGKPKAVRAVGTACGANPLTLFIPCHRVIASDGSIGGFSLDLEIKRRLLAFEAQPGIILLL